MEKLIIFMVAGLIAQLIDGSLGMGFGVIGTSVLVAAGASAAGASAVIHAAKVGTALLSGASHWRLGNVHWRTVAMIGVPGAVGAYLGATVLSGLEGANVAPLTAVILLVLGSYMIYRFTFATRTAVRDPADLKVRFLVVLGAVGGVIDAIGGGGWGPVTTPTLMTVGRMEPRSAIGSASLAELLVAVGATIGFLTHLSGDQVNWTHVLALTMGAALVAPVAAWAVNVANPRVLGTLVGVLIVVLNIGTVAGALGASGQARALLMLAAALVGSGLVLRSVRRWRTTGSPAAVDPLLEVG